MNIYIDTNILLSFYHLTSEDLEELKKLVALLKQKKARLLLPLADLQLREGGLRLL